MLGSEGDKTLLEGKRDEMGMWNKGLLRGCREGRGHSLLLKTDMIGATEIEKSLRWFKLGLDSRMLDEGHEFAEELMTQSEGNFVLQVDVAVLTLVRAVATIVALGDVSKTRGLICSRKTRTGVGDSRGAGGGIARVSCLPKDAIHGSECGALHRLQ